jgi:hypothetical protein
VKIAAVICPKWLSFHHAVSATGSAPRRRSRSSSDLVVPLTRRQSDERGRKRAVDGWTVSGTGVGFSGRPAS